MLHRGALSHFVDPSAQGHLASDKWRILDAGPDLKSARLESRLEALGSGATGPGPLSEPHSACFPWLACPVPTHVCLQATGQKRSQELLVPKDRPRQSLDEDSPAGLAAPPGTPLPLGCPNITLRLRSGVSSHLPWPLGSRGTDCAHDLCYSCRDSCHPGLGSFPR